MANGDPRCPGCGGYLATLGQEHMMFCGATPRTAKFVGDDFLSTRTSGMTEERKQLLLDVESAKRAFDGKMIGDLLNRVHDALTATSQLSQGNGAEEMREAAAKKCEEIANQFAVEAWEPRGIMTDAAKEIRALPIPPAAKGEVTDGVIEILQTIVDEMDGCKGRNGLPCDDHVVRFGNESFEAAKAFLAARKVKG